jgi:hypothetical protein
METTPTTPATSATTIEKALGRLIRSETGRKPSKKSRGVRPAPRTTNEKRKVTTTARPNPRPSQQRPPDRTPVAFGDAEGGAQDGVVLGADHHGRHDQDLRIGENSHGGQNTGADQQQIEAERIAGVGADRGVNYLPDGFDLAIADHRLDHLAVASHHRRIGSVHGDRSTLVRAQITQLMDDFVGHLGDQVALDHVAVGETGGTGQDGHIDGSGGRAEQLEDFLGAVSVACHSNVEHGSPQVEGPGGGLRAVADGDTGSSDHRSGGVPPSILERRRSP